LHQIYLLDGDQVSRRGPRMVDALETIASYLYPDRFHDHLKRDADVDEGAEE
jgi:hypothetical protein